MQLLKDVKTLAIVCLQFGDTGKGKFVDYFADWADIIARGTGGANAGHTIKCNGQTYILHLIPSGILYDAQGKVNIIGTGTVLDPQVLVDEIRVLREAGITCDHLRISLQAKLVLPQHILLDRVRECMSSGRIGTTGRGIGPAYEDHYARIGLTMFDLLNPDLLKRKVQQNLDMKLAYLRAADQDAVREIVHAKALKEGQYWDANSLLSADTIVADYLQLGALLQPFISDTDTFLRSQVGKQHILLEGAQGALLDVDTGTYKYVTSSNATVRGLAHGVGLNPKCVDKALGLIKGFIETRVGEGPFPTELGGKASAEWCGRSGVTRERELADYGEEDVNGTDPFRQGIGLRQAGGEYGATTGRPRRIGWLDLPLLRYVIGQGDVDGLILTKLDMLDDCAQIQICTAYTYQGPLRQLGQTTLSPGHRFEVAMPQPEILEHCAPEYETFDGWQTHIGNCTTLEQLPERLRTILRFVETTCKQPISVLSVGPERKQTIVL